MYRCTVSFCTCVFLREEHTDVNDPLLDGWLPCMPVIPKAELHFWALVILKHSHHHCLMWRKKGDRNAESWVHLFNWMWLLTPAHVSPNDRLSFTSHHVPFITLNPPFLVTLSSVICCELVRVCVYSYPQVRQRKGLSPMFFKTHHTFYPLLVHSSFFPFWAELCCTLAPLHHCLNDLHGAESYNFIGTSWVCSVSIGEIITEELVPREGQIFGKGWRGSMQRIYVLIWIKFHWQWLCN